MANIKINELLEKTSLTDNDYTIVDDGTTTKKYKLSTLLSGSYTKAETDNLLSLKANQTDLNETNRIQKLIIQSGIGKLFNFVKRAYNTYKVNVQSGAIATTLEKMGGKSLVANQLVEAKMPTTTYNGITITNNNDGSFTINGSSTSDVDIRINQSSRLGIDNLIDMPKHMYYVSCGTRFVVKQLYTYTTSIAKTTTIKEAIISASTSLDNCFIYIFADANVTYNNFVIKPMLIDLTKMFGSGNEPTLQECQRLFTKDYYPYNEGSIVSANVDKIVNSGKNLFGISKTNTFKNVSVSVNKGTFTINGTANDSGPETTPTQTTRLEKGTYILSVKEISGTLTNKDNNFIRIVNKDATSTIEQVNLENITSKTFTLLEDTDIGVVLRVQSGSIYNNYVLGVQIEEGSVATDYKPYFSTDITIPQSIKNLEGYGWGVGNNKNEIDFINKKFNKVVSSRAYQSGDENDPSVITDMTTTYYVLDTPQIIDITEELEGFNNSFNVEGGGTLTFHNPSDYEVDLNSNFENMEVIE